MNLFLRQKNGNGGVRLSFIVSGHAFSCIVILVYIHVLGWFLMLMLAMNLYACWVCIASAVCACLPSVRGIRRVLGLMVAFDTPPWARFAFPVHTSRFS